MPDVLHGVPNRSSGGLKVDVSQISAYARPQPKVEPQEVIGKGIQVAADDLIAFRAPIAPKYRPAHSSLGAPSLPIGGHKKQACHHPFANRWDAVDLDLDGCVACGKTRTPEGWVVEPNWQAAAVAAGVLH